MEQWEFLCPGGLRFLRSEGLFPPGTDTFVLSSLPRLRPGQRVCDLCCGAGLLSILLLQRQPKLLLTGVDVDPKAVELGRRTARENHVEAALSFLQGDVRDIRRILPGGSFSCVVCNPPYYPAGSGLPPRDPQARMARMEESCTLEDVCRAAAYLLSWGGSFCLVHKPERLTDLLCALRDTGMEPKRLRPVCHQAGDAPSLLLVEGRRGGRPGLSILPPLVLQTPQGLPTEELNEIYHKAQEDTV